jgi:tetratricopeptide (TPR) repeat protein
MGGKVALLEQRVRLAEKARSVARELACEGSSRSKYFQGAYYLLSIDALAWIYIETNRTAKAIKILEEIDHEIDAKAWPNTRALCKIFLARAYLRAGRDKDAVKKLDEFDTQSAQITNELVRVRYLLVRGDHLQIQKEASSAQASFAVYSMGKELHEQLRIDTPSAGLGHRQGHACVDMAITLLTDESDDIKNTIQDQLLSSAESIFNNTKKTYKRYSSSYFEALRGLARVSFARGDVSVARNCAEQAINEYKSNDPGEYPHIVLHKTEDLLEEFKAAQKMQG